MKYATVIEYSSDISKIQEIRPTHRAYLAELMKNGKLAISGPFVDDSGALIVYEADSAEEAESIISERSSSPKLGFLCAGKSTRGIRCSRIQLFYRSSKGSR